MYDNFLIEHIRNYNNIVYFLSNKVIINITPVEGGCTIQYA